MDYLPATNDQKVFRHSSISQFKTTLSVMKRGEWLPIVADVIEYIDCDRIVSHKAGISDKPDIGFTYPVAECRYFSDVYLLGHNKQTLTEAMPEWFGTGFYEKWFDKDVLLNADTDSLGERNVAKLRVGLPYCRAEDTLEPVE